MSEFKPVYRYSLSDAEKAGKEDIELYKISRRENIACAAAIDEVITKNFDGLYLKNNSVQQIINTFGIERVMYVLANTLQQHDYDGRFSVSNKRWAKLVYIPNDILKNNKEYDLNKDFIVNAHPAVLDGFTSMVRQAAKDIPRPSVKTQLACAMMNKPKLKPKQQSKNIDKGAR